MNTNRLLCREDVYDCEHAELWNALLDVHNRFNPDYDNEDWHCLFDDFPCEGSAVTPDHLQVDHDRRAVLLQKEMAFKSSSSSSTRKGTPTSSPTSSLSLPARLKPGPFRGSPLGSGKIPLI